MTTNPAETVTHIDGTERAIDSTLLDFLREQTRASIGARRELLNRNLVPGGRIEREIREELAVLYAQALTFELDPITLAPMTREAFLALPDDEREDMVQAIAHSVRLVQWGRRQAGLDV